MVGTTINYKKSGKKFGKEAMKHRLGLTPGAPRFVAVRVTEDQDKLGTREHATYTSGVGTLLYPTKHSRPDLFNAVRNYPKHWISLHQFT